MTALEKQMAEALRDYGIELAQLGIVLLIWCGGYLWNCWHAGQWLTLKEWGEFNGD